MILHRKFSVGLIVFIAYLVIVIFSHIKLCGGIGRYYKLASGKYSTMKCINGKFELTDEQHNGINVIFRSFPWHPLALIMKIDSSLCIDVEYRLIDNEKLFIQVDSTNGIVSVVENGKEINYGNNLFVW